MIRQISRFIGVGIVATIVHVTTAILLQNLFTLSGQAANFAGFCVAVLVSYFGHAKITFEVSSNHGHHLLRFIIVALTGLLSSSLITYLVYTKYGHSFVIAMGAVALIVPPITFLVSKFWVFSEGNRRDIQGLSVLVAFAVAALFLVMFWGRYINHDVGWYLVAVEKWFAGASLYVDLVEINPPLNFYLMAPAVAIADVFGVTPSNGEYIVVALALFFSLVWVAHILARTTLSKPRRLGFVAGIGGALVVTALSNIGQREHMMMILALPYFVGYLVLPEPDKGWARAFVGAIGLCLKPYFMVIPITLTIALMVQRRSVWPLFSAANRVIFAVGLVYIGLTMWLHPEYLNTIVPLALQIYGDFTLGTTIIIERLNPLNLLLFALMILVIIRRKDAQIAMALVLGGLAIYALQWNGFTYHLIPLHMMVMLAAFWFLVQPVRAPINKALAVAAVFVLGLGAVQAGFYKNWSIERLSPVFAGYDRPAKLMVMSSELAISFPLVLENNGIWTSRYPSLWLTPGAWNGLLRNDCSQEVARCDVFQGILDKTRTDIVSDLLKGIPDIIIIDKRNLFFDEGTFDYLEFLAIDPRFPPLFSAYQRDEDNIYYSVWRKPRD